MVHYHVDEYCHQPSSPTASSPVAEGYSQLVMRHDQVSLCRGHVLSLLLRRLNGLRLAATLGVHELVVILELKVEPGEGWNVYRV